MFVLSLFVFESVCVFILLVFESLCLSLFVFESVDFFVVSF